MNWEIISYGGGEFLRLILNGVAALMSTNDFLGLLKVAGLMALLWVMIEAAFNLRQINFQWMLGMIMVYLCFMVPRADVIVTDRVDPTHSGVVAGVPLGLAMFAGGSSSIGDWLTRSFEAVFTLPGDLRYQQNGALFAHHLIRASSRFEVTDSRLSENLSQFWRQCVFYDMLLGLYSLDQLRDADDLLGFLASHTSRARHFTYNDASGDRQLLVCRPGFTGPLRADLNAEIAQARNYYGRRLVHAQTPAQAVARFSTALPAAYTFITGISRNAEQIITQQALSNSLEQGVVDFAVASNTPAAAHSFALARAQRERRTTFIALGELAARTLPLLRNVLEGIIFGIFPVICMLLMMPTAARVGLSYLKTLLWLQLWAPLYAILNLAVTVFSQGPGHSVLTSPGGAVALTLANHSAIGEAMAESSALAGYLALSIPLISYLLLNTAGAVAASLASGILHGYEGPVSRAAEESSSGNISLGNSHVGNASWWQRNEAPSLRTGRVQHTDGYGNLHTETAGGVHGVNYEAGTRQPISFDAQSRVSESLQQKISDSSSVVQRQEERWQERLSSTRDTVDSVLSTVQSGQLHSVGFNEQEQDRIQQAATLVNGATDRLSQQSGLDENTSRSALLSGGANTGKLLSLGGSLGSSGQATISRNLGQLVQAQDSIELRQALDTLVSTGNSRQFQEQTAQTQSGTLQQAASIGELREIGHTLQTSLDQQQSYEQLSARIQSQDFQSQVDLSGRFFREISSLAGGNQQAARLISVQHGNVPDASAAERTQAQQVIDQAAGSLGDELVQSQLASAPNPAQVHAAGEQAQQSLQALGPGLHGFYREGLEEIQSLREQHGADPGGAEQELQQGRADLGAAHEQQQERVGSAAAAIGSGTLVTRGTLEDQREQGQYTPLGERAIANSLQPPGDSGVRTAAQPAAQARRKISEARETAEKDAEEK